MSIYLATFLLLWGGLFAAFAVLMTVELILDRPLPESKQPTVEWLDELRDLPTDEELAMLNALDPIADDLFDRIMAAIDEVEATQRETTPIHDAVAVDQFRGQLDDDATVRRLFADD